MYEVINGTSKVFWFEGEMLLPNDVAQVSYRIFATKVFKSEDLGVVEIVNENNRYTFRCYGNVKVKSNKGENGKMTFVIKTKN